MIFRVAGINVHFQMQTNTDLYFFKYIFINPQSVSHPREGFKNRLFTSGKQTPAGALS